MVKIVRSMADELAIAKENLVQAEKELLRYKDENELLRKELAEIRQQMTSPTLGSNKSLQVERELHPPTLASAQGPSIISTAATNKATRKTQTVPRYATPTIAFKNKAVEAGTPTRKRLPIASGDTSTIQCESSVWSSEDFTGSPLPEEYTYRDGSLAKKNLGFLRPTRATYNKAKPPVHRTPTLCKKIILQPASSDSSQDMVADPCSPPAGLCRENKRVLWPHRNPTRTWLHGLCFARPPHAMSDQAYRDLIELHVLTLETRLEDTRNDWLGGPLGQMYIDDEFQFRLLVRAREVAQRCFWDYLHVNQPRFCSGQYPGGWQQVKFESIPLMRVLGGAYGSESRAELLRFRQNSPELARVAMFKVVQLRNIISHYTHQDLEVCNLYRVDNHIKNVQKLAVHLYDARRAAEARGLRDELYKAAEEALREVEALEPLVALPFAGYPWLYHHELILNKIDWEMEEGVEDFEGFPEAVQRVVVNWDRQRYGTRDEPPVWDLDEQERPSPNESKATAEGHTTSELQSSFGLGRERPVLSRRGSTGAMEARRAEARFGPEALDLHTPALRP